MYSIPMPYTGVPFVLKSNKKFCFLGAIRNARTTIVPPMCPTLSFNLKFTTDITTFHLMIYEDTLNLFQAGLKA